MPEVARLDAAALTRLLTTFRDAVAAHAPVLDLLNVYPVPDGDTGTNMRRTLDAVVDELERSDDDLDAVCEAISHGSLMGARGNSGVILSQILRGITSTLRAVAAGDVAAGPGPQHTGPQHTGPHDAGPDHTGPHQTGPHQTGPQQTGPHQTGPHQTGPQQTGPHQIGPHHVADALRAAADGAYRAVMAPVEGTILTVARESAEAAERAAAVAGATLVDVAEAARAAADAALARTPDLLPALRDAGVVDAGGAGLVLLFDALVNTLTGRPVREPDPDIAPPLLAGSPAGERAATRVVAGVGGELDVSEQRYEVMFLLDLADASIEVFRSRWAEIGDSIVVVGGDGIWNCHVHTNDIGASIEAALDAGGRPSRIRVTDLFEEIHEGPDVAAFAGTPACDASEVGTAVPGAGVSGTAVPGAAAPTGAVPGATGPGGEPDVVATCGVVAIASGAGLAALFGSLGVSQVVVGGQTANPSTAELLAAVDAVGTDEVIVLPNNKNIIAVAEQVDALSSRVVRVVPSRTMPEGLSSLVVFDPGRTAAENQANMVEAVREVVSGEVTCAVRDSNSAVGPVRRGDWIGLVSGEGIAAVGSSPAEVAIDLLGSLLDDGREIVTVITGAGADEAATEQLLAWLDDAHADVEVEVHEGGQPLYPYLFGVE